MSQDLNPQNATAMIEALLQFEKNVSGATAELGSAGAECAQNLEEDPAGAKANASLQQKIGRISEQVSKASQIAGQIQQELEKAKRINDGANDF